MGRSLLYIYAGAATLQAAWARKPGAALQTVFDAPLGIGDSHSAVEPSAGDDPVRMLRPLLSSLDELAMVCAARRAELQGAIVRVLVSDQWIPNATLPWSSAQYRQHSALLAARAEMAELGHSLSAADTLRIDDAPLRRPRLALSYPADVLRRLAAVADAIKGKLVSVNTLAAQAWEGRSMAVGGSASTANSHRVLAVVERAGNETDGTECLLLTLARGELDGPCMDEILTRPLYLRRDGHVAVAAHALALRLGWLADTKEAAHASTEAIGELRLIEPDRHGPQQGQHGVIAWWLATQKAGKAHRAHALDAVARRARLSRMRSFLAVLALTSAGLAGAAVWRAESQLERLRSQLLPERPVAVSPTMAAPTAEQVKRIRAVNDVIRELNTPVPQLLAALQPPRDLKVALLGLELNGAREDKSQPNERGALSAVRKQANTFRVQAESPTSADMTRYVAYLGDRRPLVGAYLVRHETPPADTAMPYRFTVEVTWRD